MVLEVAAAILIASAIRSLVGNGLAITLNDNGFEPNYIGWFLLIAGVGLAILVFFLAFVSATGMP